ncbi:MAG TPA: hypothetical protein DCF99_08215 [Flavobacteriaceae bacterium]|nr:hypothetical protein [Flavobacteriaceae bacterium]
MIKNFENGFKESTQELKCKLITTYDDMIDGLENILKILNSINHNAKEYSDYFNKVMFFRALEHMGKINLNKLLTEELVYKALSNTTITREKENLLISTTYKLKEDELILLNKALQLKIKLN